MKEKRYLTTVEFYTFAEDDEVALMLSRSIAKDIAQNYDGSSAVVVRLQEKPFGREGYGAGEDIDISKVPTSDIPDFQDEDFNKSLNEFWTNL